MMLSLDTSSLVKLYIEEPSSDEVCQWVQEATTLVSSCVVYPEALSAFARRHRDGDLDDDGFHQIIQGFQRDWNAFVVVHVQESLAGLMVMKPVIRGCQGLGPICPTSNSQPVLWHQCQDSRDLDSTFYVDEKNFLLIWDRINTMSSSI